MVGNKGDLNMLIRKSPVITFFLNCYKSSVSQNPPRPLYAFVKIYKCIDQDHRGNFMAIMLLM